MGETYPELKEWADDQYQAHEYIDFDHRQYNDDELISFLQEKSRELNRIPKGVDMQQPSYFVYTKRFGSWKKALIKADLIEDIYKDIDFNKYSKEAVVEHLKELCTNKERMLDDKEIYELYPEGLIKEYFGTCNKLEAIIIKEYTKEDLIKILKKKREKLDRIPSNREMKFPKAIVFIEKFGSWQEALDELGKP